MNIEATLNIVLAILMKEKVITYSKAEEHMKRLRNGFEGENISRVSLDDALYVLGSINIGDDLREIIP